MLSGWLKDRLENVYPNDPRYSENVKTFFTTDVGPPEPLPDNLRGEAWDFVQLPLRVLMKETEDIQNGEIFGADVDLKLLKLDDLSIDILIPGTRSKHFMENAFGNRCFGLQSKSGAFGCLDGWIGIVSSDSGYRSILFDSRNGRKRSMEIWRLSSFKRDKRTSDALGKSETKIKRATFFDSTGQSRCRILFWFVAHGRSRTD